MQRIETLLQKLQALSVKGEKNTIIDIDLMLDYTRVLYADLLDLRNQTEARKPVIPGNTQNNHTESKPVQLSLSDKPHTTVSAEKKDIRHNIGINDKYQFISELFLNKKDIYEAALDELNNFDTYHQAYLWLEKHYNWEDENQTVINFYNILNNFYPGK